VTSTTTKTWQAIQAEVRKRINARIWKPGALIPHEAELALEFGCARATVNRALRGLAEEGLLTRQRRAGTRVALNPVRHARFEIPVIRSEIEGRGQRFGFAILKRETLVPPPEVRARLETGIDEALLHLETLYTADGVAHVFEDRWINLQAVPPIDAQTFATLSPNEWLVREVPFDGGDFAFSALAATPQHAAVLACQPGQGLLVLDRSTRNAQAVVTSVRLIFHAGYRMHTEI
jgi:GntR family histidine utilization transcriptional repressor